MLIHGVCHSVRDSILVNLLSSTFGILYPTLLYYKTADGPGAVLYVLFVIFPFLHYGRKRQTESIKWKSFLYMMRLFKRTYLAQELLQSLYPKPIINELQSRDRTQLRASRYCCVAFIKISITDANGEKLKKISDHVRVLNDVIIEMDNVLDIYRARNVFKVEHVGNTYLLCSGLFNKRSRDENVEKEKSVVTVLQLLLAMQYACSELDLDGPITDARVELKVGVHIGPVVGTLIGKVRRFFRIFGDTVNMSSRVCSTGVPGINVSNSVYKIVQNNPNLKFISRGKVWMKGKGLRQVFLLGENWRTAEKKPLYSSKQIKLMNSNLIQDTSLLESLQPLVFFRFLNHPFCEMNPATLAFATSKLNLEDFDHTLPTIFGGSQPDEGTAKKLLRTSSIHSGQINQGLITDKLKKQGTNDKPDPNHQYRSFLNEIENRFQIHLHSTKHGQSLLKIEAFLLTALFLGTLVISLVSKEYIHEFWIFAGVLGTTWVMYIVSSMFEERPVWFVQLYNGIVQCGMMLGPYFLMFTMGYTRIISAAAVFAALTYDYRTVTTTFVNVALFCVFIALDNIFHDFRHVQTAVAVMAVLAVPIIIQYYTEQSVRKRFLLKNAEKLENLRIQASLGMLLPSFVLQQVTDNLIKTEKNFICAKLPNKVTVFESDLAGFTALSSTLKPQQIVAMLHQLYDIYDTFCVKHKVEKIETIGDAFICVSLVDGAEPILEFALDVIDFHNNPHDAKYSKKMTKSPTHYQPPDLNLVKIRIGIATGSGYGAVLGNDSPRYHLFGYVLDKAVWLEERSEKSCILVCASTYQKCKGKKQYLFKKKVFSEEELLKKSLIHGDTNPSCAYFIKRARITIGIN